MTKKARFIKPINNFKLKVGTGGIDEKLLDDAQEIIKSNKIDFTQYAKKYIEHLEKAIKLSKTIDKKDGKEEIAKPIMQLKSSGAMFNYSLISDIADIILDFIENIPEINDDVYQIIEIHKTTIQIIIKNKLTGHGGNEGDALIKELNKACQRYNKKHTD